VKDFIAQVNGNNRVPGTIYKLLFLGRHGQGPRKWAILLCTAVLNNRAQIMLGKTSTGPWYDLLFQTHTILTPISNGIFTGLNWMAMASSLGDQIQY
jgi:hypothetical protein